MESGNTPNNNNDGEASVAPAAPAKPDNEQHVEPTHRPEETQHEQLTSPMVPTTGQKPAVPATPAVKDPYDWRNYKSNVNAAPATPKRSNAGAIVLAVFALLVSFGAIGFSLLQYSTQNQPKKVATTTTTSEDGYYAGNYQFEETTIAGVVERVAPAVVSIVTETRSDGYYSSYGESYSAAAGTGMIVTEDGYILTNKHVIEGARKIQVILDSGDVYDDVSVVGKDPLNDVAYLKIKDASGLPTVVLGDSKKLAVGEPVLAIGNALGAFQNSVTSGIISGLGRTIVASDEDGGSQENLSDLIQTDAAVNPGNSGGPLVNAAGEVVGINSASSIDYNNLGFSIPISATKGMLNNIIQNGKATRAFIGISYQNITPEVAKENELPVKSGAWLYTGGSPVVAADGPADKAGLKAGDIIVSIGGIEIGKSGSLSSLISEYMAGETIEVQFLRDGERMSTDVTLGEYE